MALAPQQQTPQAARIPPDVPSDPKISEALTNYLRNFALWARNGFAEQMRNDEAHKGLLVRAYDTAPGSNPKIFMIEVSSAGVIRTRAIGLGGDNPGS
jgi:hypothetical protein